MIEMQEGTAGPPLDHEKLGAFTDLIRLDFRSFAFPDSYLRMLRTSNGGKPVRKHFMLDGTLCPIDYFLNFASTTDSIPINIRRLNVSVFWSSIEDRLTSQQIPFAVTPSGDALCFDFACEGPPCIVLWFHEKAKENAPYVKRVASDFESFLESLR